MKLSKSQIETIKAELETFTDDDFQDLHDDMLRETYDVVSIAGLEYDVVHALKLVDPVAYRCSVSDYTGTLLDDHTEIEPGLYVNTYELNNFLENEEQA